MTYVIVFRRSARKMLEKLPRMIRGRIKEALRALQEQPFPPGFLKLSTAEGSYYRVRVGSYRIIYEVAREIRIITVIRVGHRGEVYRGIT